MVKKDITVSVGSRKIGGKTELAFKLEGKLGKKFRAAVGEQAADKIQAAIEAFGRGEKLADGRDFKSFRAYTDSMLREAISAVGNADDAVSNSRRHNIELLRKGLMKGTTIMKDYEGHTQAQKRHDAAQNQLERLQATKEKTTDPTKLAGLEKEIADADRRMSMYKAKLGLRKHAETRMSLGGKPGADGATSQQLQMTGYERERRQPGEVKMLKEKAKELGIPAKIGKFRHTARAGMTLGTFETTGDTTGAGKSKKNMPEDSLINNIKQINKKGGFFDLTLDSEDMTPGQRKLANDKEYLGLVKSVVDQVGELEASDAQQAAQNIAAKLGEDIDFTMLQRLEAEKSNWVQGLGKGSRSGKKGGKATQATLPSTPKPATAKPKTKPAPKAPAAPKEKPAPKPKASKPKLPADFHEEVLNSPETVDKFLGGLGTDKHAKEQMAAFIKKEGVQSVKKLETNIIPRVTEDDSIAESNTKKKLQQAYKAMKASASEAEEIKERVVELRNEIKATKDKKTQATLAKEFKEKQARATELKKELQQAQDVLKAAGINPAKATLGKKDSASNASKPVSFLPRVVANGYLAKMMGSYNDAERSEVMKLTSALVGLDKGDKQGFEAVESQAKTSAGKRFLEFAAKINAHVTGN